MEIKRVNINSLKIEYICEGIGADLLFLHGGSVSIRSHTPFLEELSKRFRVWAFSFPGAGKSSKLPMDWGFDDYIEITKEFIKNFEIKPILCGHSLGGAIAIAAKADSPDLFSKLILLSPAGANTQSSNKTVIRVTRNHIRNLFIGDKYSRGDLLINLFYHPTDLAKISNFFSKLNLVDEMKRIQEEVIIIWGKNDAVLPFENLEIFKKHIKKKKVYVMNGKHEFLTTFKEKIVSIIVNSEIVK
jgi:pimeloyl-ACP methyl ester carboxylesterase